MEAEPPDNAEGEYIEEGGVDETEAEAQFQAAEKELNTKAKVLGLSRLSCVAHELQRAVSIIDSSDVFKDAKISAAKLCASVCKSHRARQILISETGMTLVYFTPTRWSSAYL